MGSKYVVLALLVFLPSVAPLSHAWAGDSYTQTLRVTIRPDGSQDIDMLYGMPRSVDGAVDIYLPRRVQVSQVLDGIGSIQFNLTPETLDDQPQLRASARTDQVEIRMHRAAPSTTMPPLFSDSIGVGWWSSSENLITFFVSAPTGGQLFAASDGATISSNGASIQFGPTSKTLLQFSYALPVQPSDGVVLVDPARTYPFRIYASASQVESAASAVQPVLADLLQTARDTGRHSPWRTSYVYVGGTGESYEAGHYSLGKNSIRLIPTDFDHHAGASIDLLHEAFHLISIPQGVGFFNESINWFEEGTAVAAEKRLAGKDGYEWCDGQWCYLYGHRFELSKLESLYGSAFSFDPTWDEHAVQTDDNRGLYYRYSAFIVQAYTGRFGYPAEAAVWDDIERAKNDGSACPCDSSWLEGRLLAHAPGLTRDDLYYPYRSLYFSNRGAFEQAVAPYTTTLSEPVQSVGFRASPPPSAWADVFNLTDAPVVLPSDTSMMAAKPPVPARVVALSSRPSDGPGRAQITWYAPSVDHRIPITGYEIVDPNTGATITETSDNSWFFQTDSAGTRVSYAVRAISVAGKGDLTPVDIWTCKVPEPPTLNLVQTSPSEVVVSWSSGPSCSVQAGSPEIPVRYLLSYTSGGVESQIGPISSSSFALPVSAGKQYAVSVAATTDIGTSEPGTALTETWTVPDIPPTVLAKTDRDIATINWTVPRDGGTAITGWKIYERHGSLREAIASLPPQNTTLVIFDLANGDRTYEVEAINAVGDGPSASTTLHLVYYSPLTIAAAGGGVLSVLGIGLVFARFVRAKRTGKALATAERSIRVLVETSEPPAEQQTRIAADSEGFCYGSLDGHHRYLIQEQEASQVERCLACGKVVPLVMPTETRDTS